MKRFSPLLLAAVILITGCGKEQESSSVPTELIVTDVTSREEQPHSDYPMEVCGVEIKEKLSRAVSLSPAVTEIMSELGLTDRLCGISTYCDYPDELEKQTAGSSENPDMAIITALEPDGVFTLSGLSERDIYALEDINVAVVCLKAPVTMEEYSALYRDIAAPFIGTEKAQKAADEAVTALKNAAEGAFEGSFVYITPKLTAAGADTFENAVLSLSGENICTSAGYTDLLTLAESMPKYIIAADSLSYSDIAGDDTLAGYIDGGAEIIYVPAERFERPTARTAEIFSAIREHFTAESE